MSVLACSLLMAAYEEDENWPEIFVKVSHRHCLGVKRTECRGRGGERSKQRSLGGGCPTALDVCSPARAAGGFLGAPSGSWQRVGKHLPCFSPRPSARAAWGPGRQPLSPQVYIEDSLGERIWVDSPHCKAFVDNIQTAFNTRMPPKSMLLQGEAGRSGGDLSAGERSRSGWGGSGVFSGSGGAGVTPAREPGIRRVGAHGTGGCVFHEASVCREQPAPLPH